MRRISTGALLACALITTIVGIGAAPALANNDPHRVFLPSGPVDLPVGYCTFPTHFDVLVNKEYAKITVLEDGTTIIKATGSLKLSATNVDTGKTIKINASGPGTVTLYPDGSVTVDGTGHWLIFNLAADAAQFGLPGVMVTSGQLNETLDPSMTLTSLSVTGNVTDVCAELA